MNIAIACGGTGGHIFPGVATARVLQDHGHEVKLWLAGKDVEAPALKGWGGETITVQAEGLPTGFSLRALRSASRLFQAIRTCRAIMQDDIPDVALAMGSYASVGPAFAALWLKIPLVVHEANVVPGRAVHLFSRWATEIAISFEETRYYLPGCAVTYTGMPVRAEVERAAQQCRMFHRSGDPWAVLIMGGSRGAHRLNEVASSALVRLHQEGERIRVIHLTGAADEEAIRSVYKRAHVPHDVYAFVNDVGRVYNSADFVICRSGAATCAELTLMGLPALLVPYPFAARDHQQFNARALEKAGAADVVAERDLTDEWLVQYLKEHFQDPARWERMSKAMKKLAKPDAAHALAEIVERIGGRGHASRA